MAYQQQKALFHLRGSSWVLLLLLALAQPAQADICFLLYQNGDNARETALRKNLQEWIQSPAIRNPNVVSWVYFDALNNVDAVLNDGTVGSDNNNNNNNMLLSQEALQNVPITPLENIWMPQETQASLLLTDVSDTKHEGSYYLNYRRGQMMVAKTLPQEVNSDDPATLWAFVGTALQDCVAKNATDVMLIMNAYGAGSAGFGGDLHPGSNTGDSQEVAGAIPKQNVATKLDGPTTKALPKETPKAKGAPPKTTLPKNSTAVEGKVKDTRGIGVNSTANKGKVKDTRKRNSVQGASQKEKDTPKTRHLEGTTIAPASIQATKDDREGTKAPAAIKASREDRDAGRVTNRKGPPRPGQERGPLPPGFYQNLQQVLPRGTRGTNLPEQLTKPLFVESNADIVMALQKALDDAGGPARLSVLGFDGHYMQTFNAVNEFSAIADYVLASESLMPEHGTFVYLLVFAVIAFTLFHILFFKSMYMMPCV